MKLKNIILTTLFVVLGSFTASLNAQEYKTEVDLIQDALGKTKKDFVTSLVDIPSNMSNQFWDLYNTYEDLRKGYSQKRVNLMTKYVTAFGSNSLDDTAIKGLMSSVFKLNKQNDNTIKKFYKKLASKVSPKTAMQWFQVENYIKNAVDAKILENLPM